MEAATPLALEASWFDSLADGYAALGNPACTAAAYRRVLEVLPRFQQNPDDLTLLGLEIQP